MLFKPCTYKNKVCILYMNTFNIFIILHFIVSLSPTKSPLLLMETACTSLQARPHKLQCIALIVSCPASTPALNNTIHKHIRRGGFMERKEGTNTLSQDEGRIIKAGGGTDTCREERDGYLDTRI